jgi:hypothetical protein
MRGRMSTLDTDGDGAISREEMEAAMERFRDGGGARPGDRPVGAAG